MIKHDLIDLIRYHENKAKKLRPWNHAEQESIDEYYFHTRSVSLLKDFLAELEELTLEEK